MPILSLPAVFSTVTLILSQTWKENHTHTKLSIRKIQCSGIYNYEKELSDLKTTSPGNG